MSSETASQFCLYQQKQVLDYFFTFSLKTIPFLIFNLNLSLIIPGRNFIIGPGYSSLSVYTFF